MVWVGTLHTMWEQDATANRLNDAGAAGNRWAVVP